MLESTVPFVKASFIRNGAWNHYGIDRDIHERALASYYGCVEWVDDAVGRILDVLKYLGLNDHTIVIYTSDHGEMAGEKGAWQKSVFFDASSKVPLIIRWPGSVLRGSRIGTLTALLDLFPTICRAAGCDIPDTCDGIDLSELISRGEDLARDAIFCESVVLKQPQHAGCMIRTSQFKFSLYLDGYSELYDMEHDTREECNLTNNPDYRLIKDDLSRRIIRFWEPEKQLDRYRHCLKMEREKHYYLCSNQFMSSDGQIIDSIS